MIFPSKLQKFLYAAVVVPGSSGGTTGGPTTATVNFSVVNATSFKYRTCIDTLYSDWTTVSGTSGSAIIRTTFSDVVVELCVESGSVNSTTFDPYNPSGTVYVNGRSYGTEVYYRGGGRYIQLVIPAQSTRTDYAMTMTYWEYAKVKVNIGEGVASADLYADNDEEVYGCELIQGDITSSTTVTLSTSKPCDTYHYQSGNLYSFYLTNLTYKSGYRAKSTTYADIVDEEQGKTYEVSAFAERLPCDVTIQVTNGEINGSASLGLSVPYGTSYTTSSNKITINGLTYTVSPNDGYVFNRWISSSGTITSNTTIKASCTGKPVTLTINTNGYGTVSTSSVGLFYGDIIKASGNKIIHVMSEIYSLDIVTATPTAATGYTTSFNSWTGLTAAETVITKDMTVTANFIRTVKSYIVNISPTNGTVDSPSVMVDYGTTYTVNSNSDRTAILITFSDGQVVTFYPYSGYAVEYTNFSGTVLGTKTISVEAVVCPTYNISIDNNTQKYSVYFTNNSGEKAGRVDNLTSNYSYQDFDNGYGTDYPNFCVETVGKTGYTSNVYSISTINSGTANIDISNILVPITLTATIGGKSNLLSGYSIQSSGNSSVLLTKDGTGTVYYGDSIKIYAAAKSPVTEPDESDVFVSASVVDSTELCPQLLIANNSFGSGLGIVFTQVYISESGSSTKTALGALDQGKTVKTSALARGKTYNITAEYDESTLTYSVTKTSNYTVGTAELAAKSCSATILGKSSASFVTKSKSISVALDKLKYNASVGIESSTGIVSWRYRRTDSSTWTTVSAATTTSVSMEIPQDVSLIAEIVSLSTGWTSNVGSVTCSYGTAAGTLSGKLIDYTLTYVLKGASSLKSSYVKIQNTEYINKSDGTYTFTTAHYGDEVTHSAISKDTISSPLVTSLLAPSFYDETAPEAGTGGLVYKLTITNNNAIKFAELIESYAPVDLYVSVNGNAYECIKAGLDYNTSYTYQYIAGNMVRFKFIRNVCTVACSATTSFNTNKSTITGNKTITVTGSTVTTAEDIESPIHEFYKEIPQVTINVMMSGFATYDYSKDGGTTWVEKTSVGSVSVPHGTEVKFRANADDLPTYETIGWENTSFEGSVTATAGTLNKITIAAKPYEYTLTTSFDKELKISIYSPSYEIRRTDSPIGRAIGLADDGVGVITTDTKLYYNDKLKVTTTAYKGWNGTTGAESPVYAPVATIDFGSIIELINPYDTQEVKLSSSKDLYRNKGTDDNPDLELIGKSVTLPIAMSVSDSHKFYCAKGVNSCSLQFTDINIYQYWIGANITINGGAMAQVNADYVAVFSDYTVVGNTKVEYYGVIDAKHKLNSATSRSTAVSLATTVQAPVVNANDTKLIESDDIIKYTFKIQNPNDFDIWATYEIEE